MVGGVAAIGYGAERPTEDADCVVRRERSNLDRLAAALRELNARLRVAGMTDAEAHTLPVQIDGVALDMAGMSTWMTDAGPFDVLAGLEAANGRLVPHVSLTDRALVLGAVGQDPRSLQHASADATDEGSRSRSRTQLPPGSDWPRRSRRAALQQDVYRGRHRAQNTSSPCRTGRPHHPHRSRVAMHRR